MFEDSSIQTEIMLTEISADCLVNTTDVRETSANLSGLQEAVAMVMLTAWPVLMDSVGSPVTYHSGARTCYAILIS